MKSGYHFFIRHAGYSYTPGEETPLQGRRRCASKLARAETHAHALGCSFEWSIDPDITSADWSDDPEPWETWRCIMRDPKGCVVESFGGIDFGRDGSPWGDPYRRVVEAELACEWKA